MSNPEIFPLPHNYNQDITDLKIDIGHTNWAIECLEQEVKDIFKKGKGNMKTKIRATRVRKRIRSHKAALRDLESKLNHIKTLKLLDGQ